MGLHLPHLRNRFTDSMKPDIYSHREDEAFSRQIIIAIISKQTANRICTKFGDRNGSPSSLRG